MLIHRIDWEKRENAVYKKKNWIKVTSIDYIKYNFVLFDSTSFAQVWVQTGRKLCHIYTSHAITDVSCHNFDGGWQNYELFGNRI